MGYESTITVIKRSKPKWEDVRGFDEVLAIFEMGKIDGELINCFKSEYNSPSECFGDEKPTDLYLGGGLGEIKEDPYGDVPKECCFYDFYPVLLRCEANQHYRRYSSLMVFLQSFINSKDWDGDEIVLVHTGY